MLDGGCNWRNRSELLGVLMRWSPNTTGGSRFFVTKAEYPFSALDGRDGYGWDAEYPAPSSQVAHSDFRNGSFHVIPAIPACPLRPKGHSPKCPRLEFVDDEPADRAGKPTRACRRGDRVKRREFITLIGGAAATWPLAGVGSKSPVDVIVI